MEEAVNFYHQQAQAALSKNSKLAALQTQALQEFTRLGFPTRRDEDWKYTMLSSFLSKRFAKHGTIKLTNHNKDFLPAGYQVLINNGDFIAANKAILMLPAGVIVESILGAFEQHAAKVQPYFAQILQTEHGFHALNLAAVHTGFFIYIPRDVHIDKPIFICHWQDNASQAVHLRHLIVAEQGSQATIVELYQGKEDCNYFTNAVTEVRIENNATLNHYKIQLESKEAVHISHLAVQQAAASKFNSHLLNLGGKLVRSDATIYLQEHLAHCLLNGLYLPADKQHIAQQTTVHHLAANCQSDEDYKGILAGSAQAVFNGKVIVAKGAEKTVAKQQNKNLLLSPQAEVNAKPQLEIFADDVICSHGATVGQISEEALFYLAARGIGREEAINYLVEAFAADNLHLVDDSELAACLSTLIKQQLG